MAASADKPAAGAAAKPSIHELRRQIAEERDGLANGLDQLADEVGEAADAARRQVAEIGHTARKVAPGVAGVVVTLLVARGVMRRRHRGD